MTTELIAVSAGLALIALAILSFETRRSSTKTLVLIAVLGAIAALGRIPFAVIPSAQPTTFIVIVSAIVFGPGVGAAVGMLAAFVSNFFLGHGPWTFFQMAAWGSCGLLTGILARHLPQLEQRRMLTIYGAAWGLVFGWMMNFWIWYSFVWPHTLETWIASNLASLWFDLIHSSSNALFLWFFSIEIILILRRFKKRMSWEIIATQATI